LLIVTSTTYPARSKVTVKAQKRKKKKEVKKGYRKRAARRVTKRSEVHRLQRAKGRIRHDLGHEKMIRRRFWCFITA
jgi:hypothetical protein